MPAIQINIDVGEIATGVLRSRSEVDEFVDYALYNVAMNVRERWREEASASLRSTRKIYKAGILPVEMGNKVATIRLVGTLPNMLENGASPFDMKIGMLASPLVKLDAKGDPYMTVPFRHGTPDAIGEDFSNVMPEDVYGVMKDRPITKVTHNQVMRSDQLKHGELPERFQGEKGLGTRERIEATATTPVYGAYKHKANINQGMIRYQQLTESGVKQSHYMTFRRISLKSDANSWIHRGFQARRLAERAVQGLDISADIENQLRNFIDE